MSISNLLSLLCMGGGGGGGGHCGICLNVKLNLEIFCIDQ